MARRVVITGMGAITPIDKLYEPIKSSDDFNFFVENSNLVGQTFLDENILNSHIESFETTITTLPLTDGEIISPVLQKS